MSFSAEELAKHAMDLPATLRAELAERLVESLGDGELDVLAKQWTREAIRRREEIRSGKVQGVPGEDALETVRRAVGR